MTRNQKQTEAGSLARCQDGLKMNYKESKRKIKITNQKRIKIYGTKINK